MKKKRIDPAIFVLAVLILSDFLLKGFGILNRYNQGHLSINNWLRMIAGVLFLSGLACFLIPRWVFRKLSLLLLCISIPLIYLFADWKGPPLGLILIVAQTIAGIYLIIKAGADLYKANFLPIVWFIRLIFPKRWEPILRLASNRYQRAKYRLAYRYAQRAQELNAPMVKTGTLMGTAACALGNYQEAVEILSRVVLEDPSNSKTWYYLGKSYWGLKKMSLAIEYLSKWLRYNPEEVSGLYLRATAFEDGGDYSRAIDDYSVILENDPKRSDIYYNRGCCYRILRQHSKMMEDWKESIACANPDPKAYIALGVEYYNQDHVEKAVELFRNGISLDISLKKYIPPEALTKE